MYCLGEELALAVPCHGAERKQSRSASCPDADRIIWQNPELGTCPSGWLSMTVRVQVGAHRFPGALAAYAYEAAHWCAADTTSPVQYSFTHDIVQIKPWCAPGR